MDAIDIREIGLAQRLLVKSVLATLLGVFPIFFLIIIPFQLYAIVRLSAALKMSVPIRILTAVLMFIPIVALVPLLMTNSKATKFLRAQGLRVGLMGAKKADLPLV
ncbi:MAG: hypothetical protein IAE92_11800 [Burkholderiaceae bacterium]|nr:hypothetical protein [Burkholderiaceae bacterium]